MGNTKSFFTFETTYATTAPPLEVIPLRFIGRIINEIPDPLGSLYVLTSVVIGHGNTGMSGSLFRDRTALTQVTFDPGSALLEISEQLFKGCTALATITIPEKVTTINSAAFEDCTALKSVSGMEGVTRIDKNAFKECWSLKSMTFPKSLTSIGTDAFLGSGLTKVTLYYGTLDYKRPAKNVMFRGAIVEIIIIGAPRLQVLPMIFSIENGPPLGAYHRPNSGHGTPGGVACKSHVKNRT